MTRTSVRPAAVRMRHLRLQSPKWLGRCTECGTWGSVADGAASTRARGPASRAPAPVAAQRADADRRGRDRGASQLPTEVAELDRVLGGGLGRGVGHALGGEPGMGKSTLLLQALGAIAARRCAVPAGVRRGVDRAGADARRPARHARARSCSSSRRRRCRRSSPRRDARAGRARDRLDPGRARSRRAGRGRFGLAGARRRPGARAAREGERASRRCSSGTSPRTAGSPGRARSSTSSTRCCRSRATGITRCACCAR